MSNTAVAMPIAVNEASLVASVCRESFSAFVKEFWGEIPGAGHLTWNWHISLMCDELQRAAERVFKGLPREYDLIVNISPGSTKSSIFSILFMPWTWTRMPNAVHLSCTHTESLALALASRSRFIVKSEKYQQCFPEIVISKEQDAKGNYMNTLGGERQTCTIAGKSPTGRHADFISIDDPLDPKKALSDVELLIAENFIHDQLPSRKKDKAVAFTALVMQRLAENDTTGVMLEDAKKEGAIPVRHICLPAEIEDEKHCNVSPPELKALYVDGLMDPVRLNRTVLNDYRSKMSEYAYSGQFRQSPVKPGGQMFKEDYFNQRVKASPFNCKRVWYWDRAASTSEDACFTVGILMAKDSQGNFYIEDMVRGRWEPDERNQKMRSAALKTRVKYGPKNIPVVWVEAEGGSSGRDAWKGVARALAGFTVREQQVSKMGDKEFRADPWSTQLAAGNVKIVENSETDWDINYYIKEHTTFPRGRYKDVVDASSGAFSVLVNTVTPSGIRVVNFKKKSDNLPKIVICNKDELSNLLIDSKTLLIHISDPDAGEDCGNPTYEHGLTNLMGALYLKFTDHDPENCLENWQEVIFPYGKTVEHLMMSPAHGKKFWSFLLKKRDFAVETFVLCDENRDRSTSIACGMADILRLPRKVIWCPDDPEEGRDRKDSTPPVRHVYETVKSSRSMVV